MKIKLSLATGAIYGLGVESIPQTNKRLKMDYKIYMCVICGFIYDESQGWPDDDIPPGTRWEDVPEDWVCPDCDAGKEDFEMIEM